MTKFFSFIKILVNDLINEIDYGKLVVLQKPKINIHIYLKSGRKKIDVRFLKEKIPTMLRNEQ